METTQNPSERKSKDSVTRIMGKNKRNVVINVSVRRCSRSGFIGVLANHGTSRKWKQWACHKRQWNGDPFRPRCLRNNDAHLPVSPIMIYLNKYAYDISRYAKLTKNATQQFLNSDTPGNRTPFVLTLFISSARTWRHVDASAGLGAARIVSPIPFDFSDDTSSPTHARHRSLIGHAQVAEPP